MASTVHVYGPHKIGFDFATGLAVDLLGWTEDGITIGHEKFWDDVTTDLFGSGTITDSVFSGEQVFIEFTLKSINRATLGKLLFVNDGADVIADEGKMMTSPGRLASDMDGTGKSMRLVLAKDGPAEKEYVFGRFIPLEIVQEISSKSTTVTVRGEALIDASNYFFIDADVVHTWALSDAVEVFGPIKWSFDYDEVGAPGGEVGYSENGARITTTHEWDLVSTDDKGQDTHRDAAYQGMRMEVEPIGDIVVFEDLAVYGDSATPKGGMMWHQDQSTSDVGLMKGIGVLASKDTGAATTFMPLTLDGEIVPFQKLVFDNCKIIGRSDTRISAKQARFNATFQAFPHGYAVSYAAGWMVDRRFYTRSVYAPA